MKFLIVISFIFLGCSNRHKAFHNISDSARIDTNQKAIKNLQLLQNSQEIFKPILNFPIIKDTSDFINQLIKFYNPELTDIIKREGLEGSITFYKKIKLYGSAKDFIIIGYDYGYSSMAEFPGKSQLVFSTDGKLIATLNALKFRVIKIFPNQNPFLVVLISTARGNGGHQIFKVSSDTLENIYDGYNNSDIKTYDAFEDISVYEPNELALSIKDVNKDGYNDIEFDGKLVLIQGVTKDSIWYDNEVRKGKDTIKYSLENPFKKLPIRYVFLYNNKTKHFSLSSINSIKYSFDY